MKRAVVLAASAALALGLTGTAGAIQFDTQGLGGAGLVIDVDTFDWSPGNALGVGAVTAINGGAGKTFDLLAHADLGNFLNAGSVINGSGLNSSYEITFAGGFTEKVGLSTGGFPGAATFNLASGGLNFFEIWYDTNLDSDNNLDGELVPAAGTGFNNGTKIMSGSVTVATGAFTAFGPAAPLDSFNANSLPAQNSVQGAGGSTITVKVMPTFYDTNFFLGATPLTFFTLAFNTSQVVPFAQVDPATVFTGAGGGGAPGVVPNLGLVNGINGPDFQFQADANMSLKTGVVPEPGTMILLGSGLLGLAGIGRRRSTKA